MKAPRNTGGQDLGSGIGNREDISKASPGEKLLVTKVSTQFYKKIIIYLVSSKKRLQFESILYKVTTHLSVSLSSGSIGGRGRGGNVEVIKVTFRSFSLGVALGGWGLFFSFTATGCGGGGGGRGAGCFTGVGLLSFTTAVFCFTVFSAIKLFSPFASGTGTFVFVLSFFKAGPLEGEGVCSVFTFFGSFRLFACGRVTPGSTFPFVGVEVFEAFALALAASAALAFLFLFNSAARLLLRVRVLGEILDCRLLDLDNLCLLRDLECLDE